MEDLTHQRVHSLMSYWEAVGTLGGRMPVSVPGGIYLVPSPSSLLCFLVTVKEAASFLHTAPVMALCLTAVPQR